MRYGTNKLQRIARFFMAAKVQGLFLGFDFTFFIKKMVEEIVGRDLTIEAIIDRKMVCNVVAKHAKNN